MWEWMKEGLGHFDNLKWTPCSRYWANTRPLHRGMIQIGPTREPGPSHLLQQSLDSNYLIRFLPNEGYLLPAPFTGEGVPWEIFSIFSLPGKLDFFFFFSFLVESIVSSRETSRPSTLETLSAVMAVLRCHSDSLMNRLFDKREPLNTRRPALAHETLGKELNKIRGFIITSLPESYYITTAVRGTSDLNNGSTK